MRRGFSILELVVALALVSVLAGVAIPNVQALGAHWALDSAEKQVAAAFQVARQRAVSRNVRYRLAFQPPRGLELQRETGAGKFVAEGGRQQLPRAARLGTVKPRRPTFDTRGLLAETARVSLSVPGAGRRTVEVNVLGQTTPQ